MPITLALAGDTMLGRKVAERLGAVPPPSLVAPEVVEIAHQADLFVLNLECCISDRGERWSAPGKPFFFRAPPAAVDALSNLKVDCVTLANNHALDYGEDALADTFEHLSASGVRWVGAGPDLERARAPVVLEAQGGRLAVVGFTDHPREFAAGPARPGVAFADLRGGVPRWTTDLLRRCAGNAVLVTPHWGPNMVPDPLPYVRSAAAGAVEAGATFVGGHSAHVFHGVQRCIAFDLGDFLDDYAVDPGLRNDLGILLLVDLGERGVTRVEAVPLKLDYCHTRVAAGDDATSIRRRLEDACRALGTETTTAGGRVVIELS
jgi:poly-gamma-glutamate capsule biosynthesis protein CapA/YwtB (metallophosphatase superfamily)